MRMTNTYGVADQLLNVTAAPRVTSFGYDAMNRPVVYMRNKMRQCKT
jgi:hypothetical protein